MSEAPAILMQALQNELKLKIDDLGATGGPLARGGTP